MSGFAYVGNAVDAAGFRLAGARCWTPDADPDAAFAAALASGADAVFVDAGLAPTLPRAALEAALAGARPLLLLVRAPGDDPCRLDPAERVRAQLGLDA